MSNNTNTKWNVLTLAQAERLFRKHAFLIGDHDRVPKYIAVELFGRDAVEFARRMNHKPFNGFGVGKPGTVDYITHSDFLLCVTYNNCMSVVEESMKLTREELAAMPD